MSAVEHSAAKRGVTAMIQRFWGSHLNLCVHSLDQGLVLLESIFARLSVAKQYLSTWIISIIFHPFTYLHLLLW